jgi:hypothetical protein
MPMLAGYLTFAGLVVNSVTFCTTRSTTLQIVPDPAVSCNTIKCISAKAANMKGNIRSLYNTYIRWSELFSINSYI